MFSDDNSIIDDNKSQYIDQIKDRRAKNNEAIRRLIIDHDRRDLFATLCCNNYVYPVHQLMIDFNRDNSDHNLFLAFRGIGKSTIGTVNDAACEILQDNNVRLLFASRTDSNAKSFLNQLKQYLRKPRVTEIFGQHYDVNLPWSQSEIVVATRKEVIKEPTVRALGIESAIASQHYDIIYGDDLVDEENARTEHQREVTKGFFYNVLDPCIEPTNYRPNRVTGFRVRGTRYHDEDLYDHLINNDARFENRVLIIPAFNAKGESNCPEVYSTEWLLAKQASRGSHFFNPQYLMDTSILKGDVFDFDWFQYATKYPPLNKMAVWAGVDLAISKKQDSSLFAIVVIGEFEGKYYLLYHKTAKLSFEKQLTLIENVHNRFNPIMIGIEGNQFQQIMPMAIKLFSGKEIRARAIPTLKDKVSQAHNWSPIVERGEFIMYKTSNNSDIESQLCSLNSKGGAKDDLVDALGLAIMLASRKGRRKKSNKRSGGTRIIG